MTTYLPRSAWTSAPAGGDRMTGRAIQGVAVHWPGDRKPIGDPGLVVLATKLESYRRHHKLANGWADIAYQVAVDQAGRVWDLRGITRRSAANGDAAQNKAWGAVLLLVGPGEQPTPQLVEAFRHWRATRWLATYPGAHRVVRHGDVRPEPTACPGPAVSALVASGALTSAPDRYAPTRPTQEDEMTPAQEAKFDQKLDHLLKELEKVKVAVGRLDALRPDLAEALREEGVTDPDAVADRVAERLAGGIAVEGRLTVKEPE